MIRTLSVCFVMLLVSQSYAATITVSPGQSLQQAVDRAQPGDTVLVLPGTYGAVTSTRSGTASAPIRFVSQTPGAAHITGSDFILWSTAGDYVRIDGFDLKGVGGSSVSGAVQGNQASSTMARMYNCAQPCPRATRWRLLPAIQGMRAAAFSRVLRPFLPRILRLIATCSMTMGGGGECVPVYRPRSAWRFTLSGRDGSPITWCTIIAGRALRPGICPLIS